MKKQPMVNVARLKELMTAQDLTIEDLAEKSGVAHSTIASIRSGRRPNTSSETVAKLAAALFVSPNELLRGMEAPAEDELPAAIRQLVGRAIELSTTRQEELVRIADAFKKLEDEEAQSQPTRDKVLRALQVMRALSDDELIDLIQQVRDEGGRGNTAGRWLIDLGAAAEQSTQDQPHNK